MNNKLSKSTTIVLFICSIFVLAIFSIIPLANRLVISLKDYKIPQGLTNSPWVGLQNFKMLFDSFYFPTLVSNTITQNLITILIAVPLATITIYMLTRIKCHKTTTLLSFIIAIPALIPSVIVGSWVIFYYGKAIIDMNYSLLYGVIHGIRLASFAVIASWVMSLGTVHNTRNGKSSWIHTAVLVTIMVLIGVSRIMSTDMDFSSMVSNPIIFEKSDTISLFNFRMCFMQMNIGISTAAWAFKFFVELIATLIAGAFIFLLLKLVKPVNYTEDGSTEANSTPFVIACSIIALAALVVSVMVIIPKINTPIKGANVSYTTSIVLLFIYIITAVLSAILGALLAFPFAKKKTALSIIYLVLLIPCLYSSIHFQEYMMYKQYGTINTLFPLILGSLSAVWMIPFYAIYLYRPGANELSNTNDYIKSIIPLSLILAAIQFTISWGGMMRPLVYLSNQHISPISLLIRTMAAGGQQNLLLNILLVVPILVIWIGIGCGCAFKKCDKIKSL